MRSYRMADGRYHHRLRQSWLKSASICLERARREHTGEMDDVETDAANIGTAVHAAIETCLSDPLNENDTVEVFHDAFGELMQQPNWKWVKYSEDSARRFGERCVRDWHREVLPTLASSPTLEHTFCREFYEDDERVIELSGTIDYYNPADTPALKDWKTSGGRRWEAWEHERWDIQPTVYTWAAADSGLINHPGGIPFEFVVMDGKGVQRITVMRYSNDWSWLQHKCLETAKLIEMELRAWPTNDTHALCSPKWCPAWSLCKGQHVAATWPK